MAAPRMGMLMANMTVPSGCHFAERHAGSFDPLQTGVASSGHRPMDL